MRIKGVILASWTYSRQEWRAYRAGLARKRPWPLGLLARLLNRIPAKIPSVSLTPEQIIVGKKMVSFTKGGNCLKEVELHSEGDINLLSIVIETPGEWNTSREIRVPVPKGKLREAFRVQDALRIHAHAID